MFMSGRHRRGYGLHVERVMLRLRRRRVKRFGGPARDSLSLPLAFELCAGLGRGARLECASLSPQKVNNSRNFTRSSSMVPPPGRSADRRRSQAMVRSLSGMC